MSSRPSRKTEAVLRLLQGQQHTTADIMAELDVSRSLINKVAQAHGIFPPGRRSARVSLPMRPSSAERAAVDAEIVARREAGQSCWRIERDLRVGRSRIVRVVEAAGLPSPVGTGYPTRRASPRTPHNPAPTVITTRTCHECNAIMKESDWSTHMAEVHGVVSKKRTQQTALDRYLAHIREQVVAEPQRPPDPPCPVCGLSPCPTSIAHGRLARAWKQRGYQPRKKEAA